MGGFELHEVQQRMQESRLNRARRGEWMGNQPPGYVIGPDYKLQFDPDEQVQSIIRLILDQFASLGSISGLLRYLRQHQIEMPYRVPSGPNRGQLQWHRPHRETLRLLVRRPAYAGAYTWGLRPSTRGGRCRASGAVVGWNGNRTTVRCSYPIITPPTSHGSNTKAMSTVSASSACGDLCRGLQDGRYRCWLV